MSFRERRRLEHQITSLHEAVNSSTPEVLAAGVARFIAVLASGYLEASCDAILSAYASARADPTVQRFVSSRLGGFQNPNMEKILQLVGEFEPAKREELQTFSSGQVEDSVNSIVAIRNQVAHGADNGTSLARIMSYYREVQRLVTKLESLFPPSK